MPGDRSERRPKVRSAGPSGGSSERSSGSDRRRPAGFVLYVEGPRDRDILRSWARRLVPAMVRDLEVCTVILGGRQPARARSHFRDQQQERPELRGLCVLDRDDEIGENPDERASEQPVEPLEFFTWPRRHIESYLLHQEAIRRAAPDLDAQRLARAFAEHVPDASSRAKLVELHAKRLLDPSGPLFRGAGAAPRPSDVARAMRADEIHEDVRMLFDRVRRGVASRPELELVVVRRS